VIREKLVDDVRAGLAATANAASDGHATDSTTLGKAAGFIASPSLLCAKRLHRPQSFLSKCGVENVESIS
jgi:hypothetical protein